MKRFFIFRLIVAISAFIATISCSDNSKIAPVIDSEITVEGAKLRSISSESSDFQVIYAVAGSKSGQCVTAVSDRDWLTVVHVDKDAVSLSVTENRSSSDRIAILSFNISGAKEVRITFLQGANPDYKADMAMTFDLDVSEIKSNSVFITVNPNKMSYYYYGVVPAALYEKYQTSAEFLAAYVDAIKSKAQADANAYLTDYSLEPYLSKGYNSHEMTGLTPLTEYYLVAFDLSLSAAYSGNLSTLKFTSEKFPDSSGDFVITVDENANVVVTPSDGVGKYVLDVVSLSMWNTYSTPNECAEDFIDWVDRSNDYSIQSFLHEGPYSALYYNPAAQMGNITTGDYVAYAFGCNGAKVTSGVSYKHFHFVEPAN